MRKYIKLFISLILIINNYLFDIKIAYANPDFYSRNIQDLSFVNDKIALFVSNYNKRYQSNLKSSSFDIRTVLPKCVTPLRLQWTKSIFVPEVYKLKDNHYYIRVTCNKSVLNKRWDTYIFTTRNEKDIK